MKTLLSIIAAVVIIGGAAYLVITKYNPATGQSVTSTTTLMGLYASSSTQSAAATTSTSTYLVINQSQTSGGSGGDGSSVTGSASTSANASSADPCSYLQTSDVVSIFGADASLRLQPSCLIFDQKDGYNADDLAVVEGAPGTLANFLFNSYTQLGWQPVQGVGDRALEGQTNQPGSPLSGVWFQKGDTSVVIGVYQSVPNSMTKAEELAKLISSRM